MHVHTVDDIATKVFAGLAKHGRSPVLTPSEVEELSQRGIKAFDLRLLPSSAVGECQIESSLAETVQISNVEKIERYLVRPGDVLLTSRGTVIRTAVVPSNIGRVAIGPSLIAIRVNPSKILPSVLSAYLSHPLGHQAIREKTASSSPSMLNITLQSIRAVPIPLPPIETQRKLAELFDSAILYRCVAIEIAQRTFDAAHATLISHFQGSLSSTPI